MKNTPEDSSGELLSDLDLHYGFQHVCRSKTTPHQDEDGWYVFIVHGNHRDGRTGRFTIYAGYSGMFGFFKPY